MVEIKYLEVIGLIFIVIMCVYTVLRQHMFSSYLCVICKDKSIYVYDLVIK